MQRMTLSLLISILVMVTWSAAWEYHPLGGSNPEKIIISEDPQGAWVFSKDGGAFWINWDDANDVWGSWHNFNANDPWHMGGDVCEIDGTPYVLDATLQGHHLHYWDGDSWEFFLEAENGYFRYYDAQFFAADNGDFDTGWFLVSTWQAWRPAAQSDNYQLGIYLIDDGSAPEPDATPISGTEDKVYGKIYRDLIDPQIFYTWYGDDVNGYVFQKIEVSGTSPNFSASSPATDFNKSGYTLESVGIAGFYQYLSDPENDYVEQYLLAKTRHNTDVVTWDVWHRSGVGGQFAAADWEILWDDILAETDIMGTDLSGLTAREYDSENEYHYVYTFEKNHGLVFFDSQNNSVTVKSSDGSDNPITYLNSHFLARNACGATSGRFCMSQSQNIFPITNSALDFCLILC